MLRVSRIMLQSTISESLEKSVELASRHSNKLPKGEVVVLKYYLDFSISSTATNPRRYFLFRVKSPHAFLVPSNAAMDHNALEAYHCFQNPKGRRCTALHYMHISHRDKPTGELERSSTDPERGYCISLRVAEFVDEYADILGQHLESIELEG